MSLSQLTEQSTQVGSSRGLPTWLLPGFLLAGFLVVFALLFGERLLPAIPVETAPVVTLRTDAPTTAASPTGKELLFQASGWLEPDPYIVHVPTLVNGVVKEVLVLEGEDVAEGQLLATLIDDEARLNLLQAERNLTTIRSRIAAHCSQVPQLMAQLSSAKSKVVAEKARLSELQDLANRLKQLPRGAASTNEITTAMLRVDRQRALIAEAEADIPRLEAELETIDFERIAMGSGFAEAETARDLAQLAFDRHQIKAPSAGRILHLHGAPGKKRMLGMDDPKSATIVELYDPGKMQARIDVPLNEASQISVGQPVELTTDLLVGVTMKGVVTRVIGEADIQRNTLQVKVSVQDPDDRLRPEMLVRAKFFSPANQGTNTPDGGQASRLTLFAPAKALIAEADNNAKVWVASSERRAELRDIILGSLTRDQHRQILSGLRSGERVILPPHDQLKPGTRLRFEPTGN